MYTYVPSSLFPQKPTPRGSLCSSMDEWVGIDVFKYYTASKEMNGYIIETYSK